MQPVEKWSVLALLRFVLAAIVAVNHLAPYAALGALSIVPRLGAFEAILGFLLISGYSIGDSYKKKPDGFYLRRAQRLYPIYLAAIAITYAAALQPLDARFGLLLLANIFFLNQAVTTTSYVGPAWSLSLEVWLYACTPLFRRMQYKYLATLVVTSLFCYTVHTAGRSLFHWNYYSELGYGFNFLTLAFIWISGCILSWENNKQRIINLIGLIFCYHIFLVAGIQLGSRIKNHQLEHFIHDVPGFALKAFTLGCVWLTFKYILNNESADARKSGVMRFLGDVSYPLYLIHIPIYVLGKRWGITDAYLLLLIASASAALLYLALDYYSRRRDRKSALPRSVVG